MLPRVALAALNLAVAMYAQDFRATIQGTVTDPSSAAIANASVTVRHVETGAERVS
jgi:hypothetical protein